MNEKRYSITEYIAALKHMDIAAHHLHMLKAHYYAPMKTITATQLAKKVNYKNYNGVNLHYGLFASKLGRELGCKNLPNPKLYILVDFDRRNNEWHWIMWPNLAKALKILGIISKS